MCVRARAYTCVHTPSRCPSRTHAPPTCCRLRPDAGRRAEHRAAFPNGHHQRPGAGEGGELCAAEGAVLRRQPRHGHRGARGGWCVRARACVWQGARSAVWAAAAASSACQSLGHACLEPQPSRSLRSLANPCTPACCRPPTATASAWTPASSLRPTSGQSLTRCTRSCAPGAAERWSAGPRTASPPETPHTVAAPQPTAAAPAPPAPWAPCLLCLCRLCLPHSPPAHGRHASAPSCPLAPQLCVPPCPIPPMLPHPAAGCTASRARAWSTTPSACPRTSATAPPTGGRT